MSKVTNSELISQSLDMRANWIETGTVTLSANDAASSNQHKLIKMLDSDQIELVRRLRSIAEARRVV